MKCPWCARDSQSLEDVSEQQKEFCLKRQEGGSFQLSRDHPYYLQCQLQIHVTRRAYCDFVVWHEAGVHSEPLLPDLEQLKDHMAKAERFFRLCILPELAGKWFTQTHTSLPASN